MGNTGSNDRRRGSGRRTQKRHSSRTTRPAAASEASTGLTRKKAAARRRRSGGTRRKASGKSSMQFTIASDFVAQNDVQEQILTEIARNGFKSDDVFGIKLALEEALINAIKHGNKLDPGKQVHIEARITPKQAEIIIEDEGPGFDRCCVPDPTLEENLQKCSGRGILLMEAYMTSVEFSKGGRRVRMIKNNE
jgi:serine/threonine-protein kinase RsbW